MADSGLVATEVMALLVGRAKWMEEGDVRYLLFAIAFAALPAWGALEGVCVSHLIPEILTAGACQATRPLAWIAVVWLGTLPIIAVLFDFWRFQSRRVVAGP